MVCPPNSSAVKRKVSSVVIRSDSNRVKTSGLIVVDAVDIVVEAVVEAVVETEELAVEDAVEE